MKINKPENKCECVYPNAVMYHAGYCKYREPEKTEEGWKKDLAHMLWQYDNRIDFDEKFAKIYWQGEWEEFIAQQRKEAAEAERVKIGKLNRKWYTQGYRDTLKFIWEHRTADNGDVVFIKMKVKDFDFLKEKKEGE